MDRLERVKKVLQLPVSIDIHTVTDRVNKWETFTGQIQEGFVTEIARRLLIIMEETKDG